MSSIPFLMKLSNKLILGSGSPRRKQLLTEAGFQFEVKIIPCDESFPSNIKVTEVAEYLAIEKNKAYREIVTNEIIVTADTTVVFKDQILDKPKNENEAIRSLETLSGKIHQVITGVCISSSNLKKSFSSNTEVKFKQLTKDEINHYVSAYKPFDKAGSYAIQEWIGLIGIEWIKGSYFNVMGLPIDLVYKVLKENF